jgi:hypothetical protein
VKQHYVGIQITLGYPGKQPTHFPSSLLYMLVKIVNKQAENIESRGKKITHNLTTLLIG